MHQCMELRGALTRGSCHVGRGVDEEAACGVCARLLYGCTKVCGATRRQLPCRPRCAWGSHLWCVCTCFVWVHASVRSAQAAAAMSASVCILGSRLCGVCKYV